MHSSLVKLSLLIRVSRQTSNFITLRDDNYKISFFVPLKFHFLYIIIVPGCLS